MRDFLMQAKKYEPDKHYVCEWYWSEKLDGKRAFWDGGVTRDMAVRDVPWANDNNKFRMIPRSTGLWSRYGNVIRAPDWFLDQLPNDLLLDGELWMGHGLRQETMSVVSRHDPDPRWRAVNFMVFESPSIVEFCKGDVINNPNFSKKIDYADSLKLFLDAGFSRLCLRFEDLIPRMVDRAWGTHYSWVEQHLLPKSQAVDAVDEILGRLVAGGSEGIVLRNPVSYWTPDRNTNVLKVKPFQDDEALVVGYTGGIGKYKGMLGALIVVWNGLRFELSGFTDAERTVVDQQLFVDYMGIEVPLDRSRILVPAFPLGEVVTFRYTGTTNKGIPCEARYWRKMYV